MSQQEPQDTAENVAAWTAQWEALNGALHRERVAAGEARFARALQLLLGEIPDSWTRERRTQRSGLIAFHAALTLRGAK